VPLSRRWSTMFMPARMRRLARTLMILVAVLGVGVVSTGIAQAELSIGNGEYIIINSLHVGYPALSTTSKCGKSLIDGPGGLPVTVVATFVNADGSGPNAPYGGLESWSGGTVGTDDDHYGTDVGGNQTQFFHVMAYPADGWHGAGAYRFDPFAQDGSLKVAYTATERTVNVAGYPPSGGGEFVKCPFAHPFDINNVLSDAAKSGAEEVLGAACEACSAWYDGVKQALDFNDLFNSSLKNSIVDDPPDNNYQQLVTAQPAPVLDPPAGMTADQDSTLLNLESALATDIGLDRALLTSEDRAWGALNGGDRSAYLAQTKAIAAFADQLAGNIPALDQLFTDFQAAYAPSIPAFSVTHQDVARYQVDSMKGVMPDEAAVLSQLGATTADEAQIVDAIISVDATQISAADGVNALFQQNDDALVGPLQGMATWARDVATTPPPVVLDVSPGTLDPSGGQQVTVTGSNLTGVTALTFGASTPTSGQGIDVACTSDTECTAYAPPGHGTVDVVAVGPGGPSATGPQDRVSYVAPAKPVVTRIYPSSGPISGRTEVSVTGSGLSGGTVYFGPTPSDSVRCSDTLCTAYSPTAASAGAVDIQVQTDGGLSDTSSADRFTYLASAPPPPAAPVIGSITPSSGSSLGGETVTISGSHFSGATGALFGPDTSSSSFDVVNDSTMTAVAPPSYAASTVDVQVAGPGGTSAVTPADHFTYVVAAPTVTGISPSTGPNTGGTPFTITGTNLGSASTSVQIGDNYVYDAVCSDTRCTGTTPLGTVGAADVTVWTDNGQATLPGAFTYYAGPVPVIGSVTPDTGNIAGGTSVVISGSHLDGGQVTFGDSPGSGQTCTDTTCVATAPAGEKGGYVDVHVTTAAGTSATTSADTYSYAHLAAPVVTAVSPNSGYLAGYDDIRVTGTDLDSGTVSFGGAPSYGALCTMTYCDTSVPAGAGVGPVVVTVTTASGTSSTTPTAADEYTYVQPAVTGVSPSSGWTAGGTKVTISGTDLPGTPDTPADDVQIRFSSGYGATGTCTGTSCTVTSPAVGAAVGNVDVSVEGGLGTWSPVTSSDVFHYFARPAPTLTSVSPSAGSDRGGDQVIVTGTDLDDGAVKIGTSVLAGTCGHTSCTVVTKAAPGSVDGSYDVVVTTPAGTSAVGSADHFTFAAPAAPSISGISPASGSIVGGTAVTISGSHLTGGAVTFGGKAATGVTCYAGACTVTTPSQTSAGAVTVSVTTSGLTAGGGTATTSYGYVVPPAPVLTAVDPAGGPKSGGTPFSVAGTDLDGGSVTVGGTAAIGAKCHPTYCQGMTPAGTTGAADVVVTTPGGISATTTADHFTYSPVTITEHTIPGVSVGTGAGGVVRGGNGDMWFAMPDQDKIGRVSHTDGTITTYNAVAPASGSGQAAPTGIALGPDNRVYYAERNTDVVVAIDDAGNQQSYPVGGSAGDPGGSVGDLRFVTAGPDGRMWFTLGFSGAIGALDPVSGHVQLWHLPNPWVLPYNIVAGPDGRMWFTEVYGDGIGAITTSGAISEYLLPTPGPWGWGLTVGADNRLWLGESMARNIAAVTTDGVATEYPVPDELDDPQGVIAGADGRMWFTAPDHDTINALDPTSGAITEYAMPPGYPVGEAPRYLAMDTSGTLWVTENLGAHILSVAGITSSAPPAVTSVSPDHGGSGTTVTISGSNLQGATGVSFGGVAASSFTVTDPVHLTAVAPAGTGVVDVTVTTASGPSATAASDRFNYGSTSPAAPDVRSISPATGPVSGGTVVTVTGRHLAGGTVAFGSAAASAATCSDTSCTATAPAAVAGPVDVTVTTAAGASAVTDADRYVYLTPKPGLPTVTSISPTSGSDAGGTSVTVTGTNLAGGSIAFGVEIASGASCTATSCTVASPRGGAGPVDVRVTTAGGTTARTSADRFTYIATTKVPLAVTTTVTDTSFDYSSAAVSFSAQISPAVAGDTQFMVDGAAVGDPVPSSVDDGYVSSTYFSGPAAGGYFSVGTHQVSAVFTPVDSDYYAVSTGTTSFTVTHATTAVSVGTYSSAPTAGQTVGLYAQVQPAAAAGTVQFSDGATALGSPVAVSSGGAFLYTSFTQGAHTITARFAPTDSTDYAASTGSFTLNVGAAAVAPDTTSLRIVGPTSTSYGRKVTVSTTLTDVTSGHTMPGAAVVLYRRASSKVSWSKVVSRTTSSTGTASTSFTARANEQLEWRYAGNASHHAATSAIKSLSVKQVVAISATRTKVAVGKVVKLYGWVSPASAGQRVYLQLKVGTKWKTLTSVLLKKQRLPNGATRVGYVFSRTMRPTGKQTFRVSRPRTATLAAGLSRTITITIT
jgi:streptogramin lyase